MGLRARSGMDSSGWLVHAGIPYPYIYPGSLSPTLWMQVRGIVGSEEEDYQSLHLLLPESLLPLPTVIIHQIVAA